MSKKTLDFLDGPVVDPPANAGDMVSVPGPEDLTGCKATEPVFHNYWVRDLQLLKTES